MKWSMDTHKYISEVTRKALKVLFEKNITSESSAEEIDAAEHILADENVYKDYKGAKGRIEERCSHILKRMVVWMRRNILLRWDVFLQMEK